MACLDLGLFGYFQGVFDSDAEIANRALELRMAEKKLHGV
jgi:hypothetical protein